MVTAADTVPSVILVVSAGEQVCFMTCCRFTCTSTRRTLTSLNDLARCIRVPWRGSDVTWQFGSRQSLVLWG